MVQSGSGSKALWWENVELLDNEGQEVEFVIKRVLSVNEPSKANSAKSPKASPFPSAFPGATELQQLQLDLYAQREDIKRIDNNGLRIVSALEKRATRVEGEVTKLKSIISTVHQDINGLRQELRLVKSAEKAKASAQSNTALAELELRLASVTTTLSDVGQQLAAHNTQLHNEIGGLESRVSQQQKDIEEMRSEISRTVVAAADHAQDMAALRAEMAQLRRQMGEIRAHGTGRVEMVVPSRELEVLTHNISKIGNRASQVETLQMELEMLKGRHKLCEAGEEATTGSSNKLIK
ncbi:hypothetical protein NEMBOFW57_002173 [Staphylotrichum longicolle]|uniref:Uncharacterized protein n=1 Tax=Staphylotrichum longicolle TaxID=669026 RepID=A0AAD4I3D2_9PEZI|nr:hypothetical protein NEMBOFW57_002173 [Staphylotrichum longicolle]